MTLSISTT